MPEEQNPRRAVEVKINVDCSALEQAVEKANRLVELLREASTIIDSFTTAPRSGS